MPDYYDKSKRKPTDSTYYCRQERKASQTLLPLAKFGFILAVLILASLILHG